MLICIFLFFRGKKVAENNEKQTIKALPVDQSDNESESSGYKQNTRLI